MWTAKRGKHNILKTACINVSILTTPTKQEAIRKWTLHEDVDIVGICETGFKDGCEPLCWIKGYRAFYNSLGSRVSDSTDDNRFTHKWGTAIIAKESIKVCNVIRPAGALTGRVVMIATYMEASNPRMLWIICSYAPVRMHEHDVFFGEMTKVWEDNIKKNDQVIVIGDLNAHLLGSKIERSAPNDTYDKESTALQNFVLKHGLIDSRALLGALLIRRDFTYTHYDGSVARLDYHLTTSFESVLNFQTIDFNRIATNHRAIVVDLDLFRLTGGWKTIMKPHIYPTPINVTNSTAEQLSKFAEIEAKWLASFNRKLYVALANNQQDTDNYVIRKQQHFLKELANLCSKKARKIWEDNKPFTHKTSKEKGILMGKITWLRRAYRGAKELNKITGKALLSRRAKSLQARMKTSKWFPKLTIKNWSHLNITDKHKWMARIFEVYTTNTQALKETEKREREEAKEKRLNFFKEEGNPNTSKFRRWKLRLANDPDGEIVKSKSGEILIGESQIRKRYGEYYADLFKGEESRTGDPNYSDRERWFDPQVILSNREKLMKATKGVSLVQNPPSLQEYYDIVKSGDPNSSGGPDLIQYGILSKLSIGTHQAILGLISAWWRTKELPPSLRIVEVCSLHKKGDRTDLINKRGVGLVSKLILIMETVLLNRINRALDIAGTRSLAQGGARKGVNTSDVIVTLVNVIHHATRNNQPLHLVELDLFKFFDRIPHRAFVDAHHYFGFDDNTIAMASLFWENFVGVARSRFGLSDIFPINIGNIQGLAGSPSRSSLVLDMLLCMLQRKNYGYKYTTDNHYTDREIELDHQVTNIYAVSWIDDITLIESDLGRMEEMLKLYSDFINFYGMKLVPDKCKHYFINYDDSNNKALSFSDLNGTTHVIKKVSPTEAFRCLGVFLNMNTDWAAHADHIIGKLDSFTTRIGKHWSPAWLTAKVVNSNAIPAITYGLSVANLQDREIAKMQSAITRPVAKDGSHTKFAPRKAYSLPIEHGGYNVASVSAIYKASKIGGIYHYLNSTYPLSRITTRMTFWDLLRIQGNLLSPLDGENTLNKEAKNSNIPDYMMAAAEILKENRGAIFPREGWDLDTITIVSFTKCVAGWNSKSGTFDFLKRKGIRYMHQISTWFQPTLEWNDLDGVKISIATLTAALKGLNMGASVPTSNPLDIKQATRDLNSSRSTMLKGIITQGIANIITSNHALSFVPNRYKNNPKWNALRLRNLGKPNNDSGRWYSDGARSGDRASFAVVTNKDELIVKSNTVGRSTSQRAELFGLEAAMYLGPNTDKVLDPYFIVRTTNKACRNEIATHEWSKIDNRSIIKSIKELQSQGSCSITWVKGHQKINITEDGKHNIYADEQAKTLMLAPTVPLISEAWSFVDEFFFTDRGDLFEGDIRRLVFEQVLCEEYEIFCLQNSRFKHENWWMEKPSVTESAKYATLRFKIFSRTLPTHDRLRKSFPGLYNILKCPGCNTEIETDTHVFVHCPAYAATKWKVWEYVCTIFSDHTDIELAEIGTKISNWINPQTNHDNNLNLWFLGGIPETVKVWLCKHLKKAQRIDLWQRVHKVLMEAIDEIWKSRCEKNCAKGWTYHDLHLDFIEDALLLENNLLCTEEDVMWEINEEN